MAKDNDSKPLYEPFVSKAKGKKYSVYVKSPSGGKKLIHFGAKGYPQFRDRIGHYSSLDHKDPKRRKSYLARHGNKTDKNTAGWWAQHKLW